jgi:hypothetical protein
MTNFDKIQNGMCRVEVEKLLGKPSVFNENAFTTASFRTPENGEYKYALMWDLEDTILIVEFDERDNVCLAWTSTGHPSATAKDRLETVLSWFGLVEHQTIRE